MTRFGLARLGRLFAWVKASLLAGWGRACALLRGPRAWAVWVGALPRRGAVWVGRFLWRSVVLPPLAWCRRAGAACRRLLVSVGQAGVVAWRWLVWSPLVWICRACSLAFRWLVWLPLLWSGRACAFLWRRATRGRTARRVAGLAHKALYQPANPKPASFVLLLTLVTVLIVVGLIMVLSASSVESLREYGSSWAIFERQVLWVALGAVALVLGARIDYRRWQRFGTPLLIVCLVLLLAVLVPSLGVSSGGSSRWLGVGSLRMQPSELAKLGVVIFGADLLTRRANRMRNWKATVRPLLLVVGVACLLVIKQPDLGTAIILVCITLGLLFAAGTSTAGIGTLLGLSGVAALLVALAEPYRRARLLSFLDPWAHASGSGYQVVQSLVGLGSGHLLGVGLGASAAKWGFLPNAYTDFIFSVLGEELGLIGSLLVVGLFVALAVVGIRIAVRSPDRFGGLMAAGITTWIVVQAVINIGGVAGMLPVTGVPLPFISFGGSSLVIMMAGVGVMLNVASREGAREAPELDPSRVRSGRTRLATLGVTPLHGPAAAVGRDGLGIGPERPATPVARRETAATQVGRRQTAANQVARRQSAATPVARRQSAPAGAGGRRGSLVAGTGRRRASATPRRPAVRSGSRVADPRVAGARARAAAAAVADPRVAGVRARADATAMRARAQVPPRAPVLTARRRPRVTRVEL